MFKIIKFFVLSLILIALSFAFYIWVQKKTLLEQFLSHKLNMEVELQDVSIGWGQLSLKQLRLKNHSGSQLPDAFVGNVTLSMDPMTLLTNHIEIARLDIDDPILYLELYNFTGSDNNWSRSINSFPSTSDKTFVIHKLTINNLQFHPIKHAKKTINLPKIAKLQFENLGSKTPLTITQISQAVFESILFSLTSKPGLGEILKNIEALPKQALQGATSTIPLDVSNKFQESWHFIKRKSQETKNSLENWIFHKE